MSGSRGLVFLSGVLIAVCAQMAHPEEPRPVLGGTLLYSRLMDGTWQIWSVELSTQRRRQLSFSPGDKRYPVWSPQGDVAFRTSNYDYYLMRPEREQSGPFLKALWPIRDVTWSPDGSRLAFSRAPVHLVDNTNIWVSDAEGGSRRVLTRGPGIQQHPTWSPDGTRIAYIAGQAYRTLELYVMKADGTEPQQLTHNQAHELFPAWSPDGTRIAFSSDLSGDYDIWMIPATGGDPIQLTHSPGLDSRPAWSPDGRFVAFTTNRSGTLEIWVMAADGADAHRLEWAEGGVCDPAWK